MAKEDYLCKGEDEPWRVLEFYSGIGGMRYSIMKAGISATIVKAFDINDKANDVYEHNFGHRPFQCDYAFHRLYSLLKSWHWCELGDNLQGSWHYKAPKKISWNFAGNIQSLTAAVLDNYGAHAWLLSPPCQPYTRQGLQKDSDDARASSFLKILDLIAQMSSPPLMLFVENVVGFETSDTHNQMMQIFAETGFVTQEFILSPLQFGIPYSRPRYFCLAKRIPLSFQNPHFNHHLHYAPGLLLGCDDRTWTQELDQPHEMWEEGIHACEPISKFLEFGTAFHKSDNEQSYLTQYMVPQSLIERWASVMDIVYPDSRRCCCFTKSYYRYVKGTGSLLMTMQYPSSVTFQAESNGSQASSLKEKGLRYFTPREVANLHSFPESFQFPEHISLRQRYALLGNSLSVAVVGPLLHYLFTETSLQTR